MTGGIDLAAHWAGFATVGFVERDSFCQKVLTKHWPGVPIWSDVKDVTAETLAAAGIRTVDLISGGFPCQPFSVAGKRRGKDDDRYLWPEMFRIIQEVRPTWVLGENVAGFVNMGLDTALFDLETADYETQPFIIPACAVGASHRRDRVFLVSHTNSIGLQRGAKRALNKTGKQQLARLLQTNIWYEVSRRRNNGNFNGVPNRVHRLRALGNAVVPYQVYPILKCIADMSIQFEWTSLERE